MEAIDVVGKVIEEMSREELVVWVETLEQDSNPVELPRLTRYLHLFTEFDGYPRIESYTKRMFLALARTKLEGIIL